MTLWAYSTFFWLSKFPLESFFPAVILLFEGVAVFTGENLSVGHECAVGATGRYGHRGQNALFSQNDSMPCSKSRSRSIDIKAVVSSRPTPICWHGSVRVLEFDLTFWRMELDPEGLQKSFHITCCKLWRGYCGVCVEECLGINIANLEFWKYIAHNPNIHSLIYSFIAYLLNTVGR